MGGARERSSRPDHPRFRGAGSNEPQKRSSWNWNGKESFANADASHADVLLVGAKRPKRAGQSLLV